MLNRHEYKINKDLTVQSIFVGNEGQKIIIADNLLENPHGMVDFAAQNENYERYTGHCNFYPGIKLPAPKQYSDALMALIKPVLVNEYEGISADWEMNKADCAISLITIKPENLRKVQLTPHFDSANTYQFAILLYLCDDSHGGTAFYRHNATGYETITQDTRRNFEDHYFKEIEEKPQRREYFTESDEHFTRIGLVDAKFNRMIIYRSCLLHSPYINSAHSINSNPRAGRLTVNSFVAF